MHYSLVLKISLYNMPSIKNTLKCYYYMANIFCNFSTLFELSK